MDIKLDIYKDRFCRELDRTVTAPDFSLSLQICEDVLEAINIDMFVGGIQSLSEETSTELFIDLVHNGLPFFKDLLKELYDVSDEEIGKTKLEDIAMTIMEIAKYSFGQLGKSFKGKN